MKSKHSTSKRGCVKGIGPKSKLFVIPSSKIMLFGVDTFGMHLLGVNKDFAGTLQLGKYCAGTLKIGIICAVFVFLFLPRLNKKDEEAITQERGDVESGKKEMIGPHEQDFRAPAGYPAGWAYARAS